jgi:hypothetical protein
MRVCVNRIGAESSFRPLLNAPSDGAAHATERPAKAEFYFSLSDFKKP